MGMLLQNRVFVLHNITLYEVHALNIAISSLLIAKVCIKGIEEVLTRSNIKRE